MTHKPSTTLLEAALYAAERGWPLFPLKPNGKRPALHSEAHCPRSGHCAGGHQKWEQRATCDPQRITACWQSAPYNIGIATGPAALVVIDLDTPKTGEDLPPQEWKDMPNGMAVFSVLCERAGQEVPATFTTRTGRGGRHLYFTAPRHKTLRSGAGRLGWKVDTRAAGGYVVGAGSVVHGRPYVVEHEGTLAPLPAWLTQLLTIPAAPARVSVTALSKSVRRASAYADAALRGELDKVCSAREGGRNHAVYGAAYALGRLVAAEHLDEQEVSNTLTQAGLSIGLPERECAIAIRSGLTRGALRAQGRAS